MSLFFQLIKCFLESDLTPPITKALPVQMPANTPSHITSLSLLFLGCQPYRYCTDQAPTVGSHSDPDWPHRSAGLEYMAAGFQRSGWTELVAAELVRTLSAYCRSRSAAAAGTGRREQSSPATATLISS